MPIQYVNTGSSANAGNGDSIRLAFNKVNNNFALVATQVDDLQQGKFDNITIAGTATFLDIISTGTAQLNNVSIAGTVSGTSTFQNIIVEQVATINDLYANTIASTNTATFQDVVVNGQLIGDFVFNKLDVATTITVTDLNVGESIYIGQYQFIQTNNLSQDFAIVKDDINGLTFVLRNVNSDSYTELNLQDNIQGGLSIVHQSSTNNSGNYDAGQNYIYGQTPDDTLNIGKFSDINIYANEAQYYDPNAATAPSINISKADGLVRFGSDVVYMGGISFQVVSDGSALVNGVPIQGGGGGNGYTGSQGLTGLSGYTGSAGFGYSGSKGDTGPQGISVTLVGSTSTSAGLPVSGNPGDGWIVNNTGHLWFWNTVDSVWNDIGAIVGPQGNDGPRGDQGLPGDNGINGYTGSFGNTGYTGSAGTNGTNGYTGSAGTNGTNGYWGSKGFTGSAGTNGTNGFTGSAGTNGTNGYTGSAGTNGTNGYTGSAGTNGYTGSTGLLGYYGSVGARGFNGFTGSAGIAGTNGTTGFTGSVGDIGYTGSSGSTGYTGSVGEVGYTGSAGTDGSNGYTGSQGERAQEDRITSSTYSVVVGADGSLNLPDSGALPGTAIVQSTANIRVNSNGSFWTFNSDGFIDLPGGNVIDTGVANKFIMETGGETDFEIFTIGTGTNTNTWSFGRDGTLTVPTSSNALYTTTNALIKSIADIQISAGDDVGSNWTFGGNGQLTLPGGAKLTTQGTSVDLVAGAGGWSELASNNGDSYVWVDDNGAYVVTNGSTSANMWTYGTDGSLTTPGHLLPDANLTHDLGSTSSQWRSIYVGTGTIYIGGVALGVDNNNYVTVDGNPIITVSTAGSLTVQGDTNIVLGSVIVSDTAPATTTEGALWFNSVEAHTYVVYNGQWIDANPTVIPPPDTNPTLESVTFNDASVQTTAWPGVLSYNDLTDKPVAPTFVGGGGASTWLTAD